MVNRDLSATVLRHFLRVREQELAEGTLKAQKRTRGTPPAPPRQPAEPGQPVSRVASPGQLLLCVHKRWKTRRLALGVASSGCVRSDLPIELTAKCAGAVEAPVFSLTLTSALRVASVPFCAQKGARVLEGLAASGLRSIRYALEIDGIARIDANDLDGAVVEVPRCLWTGPVAVASDMPAAVDITIGNAIQSSLIFL